MGLGLTRNFVVGKSSKNNPKTVLLFLSNLSPSSVPWSIRPLTTPDVFIFKVRFLAASHTVRGDVSPVFSITWLRKRSLCPPLAFFPWTLPARMRSSSSPFWSNTPCVFCLYTRLYTLLKVVSYYDLSVLHLSLMGLQKEKVGWGVGGWSELYPVLCWIFGRRKNFAKPLRSGTSPNKVYLRFSFLFALNFVVFCLILAGERYI